MFILIILTSWCICKVSVYPIVILIRLVALSEAKGLWRIYLIKQVIISWNLCKTHFLLIRHSEHKRRIFYKNNKLRFLFSCGKFRMTGFAKVSFLHFAIARCYEWEVLLESMRYKRDVNTAGKPVFNIISGRVNIFINPSNL